VTAARRLRARFRRATRRTPRPQQPRIAYLCDQYPAVSHTFILTEVRALRELDLEIDTISIRRSDPVDLLSERDREEFGRTFAVLPIHPLDLIATHVRVLAARPRRYVATARLALSLSRQGARGRLWQLFYLAEAGVVFAHCRRRRIRHVHAEFTTPAADIALLAAHLGGRGWSWSFAAHGTDIFEADRRTLAEKVRRARFVVCASDFGRSQLMMLVDEALWPRIHVVPCGTDLRRFTPQTGRRVGKRASLNVLTVGRLVAVKGHSVLLDAIGQLRARGGLRVALEIVGDGPRRAALEERTRALGLTDLVTFHGRVGHDDITRHYAAADVFCLPSFAEGVPVVLMEAMAMELPVVATDVMGVRELVEDGATGLLVRPGRADLLADAIARLAGDADLRRRLGAAGRQTVLREFDVRQAAEQIHKVFEEVLGSRASSAPARRPRITETRA
jgi:colanic acid/amylovoran biosynthesis glycosyltransferase